MHLILPDAIAQFDITLQGSEIALKLRRRIFDRFKIITRM